MPATVLMSDIKKMTTYFTACNCIAKRGCLAEDEILISSKARVLRACIANEKHTVSAHELFPSS